MSAQIKLIYLLMVLLVMLGGVFEYGHTTIITTSQNNIGGLITLKINNPNQYNALIDDQSMITLKISIYELQIVESDNNSYPYIPDLVELTTLTPKFTNFTKLQMLSDNYPKSTQIGYKFNVELNQNYIILGQIVSGMKTTSFNGWYRDGPAEYFKVIKLTSERNSLNDLDFIVEGVTPYPKEGYHQYGYFRFIKGLPVLSLFGNEAQRGYAHGYLMAQHVIDFFRFYILEGTIQSASSYLNVHVPALNSAAFTYDKEFMSGIQGVYSGMLDSKVDLTIPELGRKFLPIDIIAINGYIELEYIGRHGVPKIVGELSTLKGGIKMNRKKSSDSNAACTQFSVWGKFTSANCPKEQQSNIISVRNMDGEIDMKKVTVHSVLITTVESDNPQDKRYVSVMWPGFIGTLSAINEDGVYSMMNYGVNQPGTIWSQGTIVAWIVKDIIQKTSAAMATPPFIQQQIESRKGTMGGSCMTGCILVFSRRVNNVSNKYPPSFVYEGDWKSGMMRVPGQAYPYFVNNSIGASNHNHLYGVESGDRDSMKNFGQGNGFSSMWRYQAASNLIDEWARSIELPITEQTKSSHLAEIDCNSQMRQVLQRACRGYTEHSIMFRPMNDGKINIDISVAQPTFNGWDAPFLDYTSLEFNEFFKK
ncbi:hypothetical protein NAEGRDRAFT_80691 [Naegleria gruberi]|uniref:Uncharacterized protein n=1 Tax=Naegleria gruberi TaxID=5762 RepID=D2VNZ1_NAEGR|nr:uncharacterized protein NAEGRDRAFT_80691 [Naegleria gruberi]EFC41574.1 hypothetical protein NAEGRDRAFT_80691 [Naegleria gruberi]|eukprot:XP_002674318.1 hypothetical protein NAEGRDRAFT_80691 [Naegleria gruberi strain NEG-M]